jgi:hypothetical protein
MKSFDGVGIIRTALWFFIWILIARTFLSLSRHHDMNFHGSSDVSTSLMNGGLKPRTKKNYFREFAQVTFGSTK